MTVKKSRNYVQDLLALACGGSAILIILLIMNRDYPLVGHDYAYFIPHMIDTELHIRLNGLTIQWYTPSFGGGLPAFPNPQHIQYSIAQILSLGIDPWSAVLVSTIAIALVGYYFFYRFLKEKLDLDWMPSALGATFFIANGFYIEHLIAGQMGYQLFPLLGVILYSLTNQRRHLLYNSAVIASIFGMMVHQAGFYLIVILLLSLGIILPILFLYKPRAINLRSLGWTILFTSVLTLALTASKVYAIVTFMQHYPREAVDVYETGLLQAMIGVIAQLLGVMNLGPILSIAQYNPELITGVLSNITGARYGIWETDTGLSPILVFILAKWLIDLTLSIRRNSAAKPDRSQLLALTLLAAAVWITLEFATARGMIYSITKQLPVFKSLHINVRFVAALIAPLVIIGAFQSQSFFLQSRRRIYFLACILITVISPLSYFSLSDAIHIRRYDAGMATAIDHGMQSGKITPVTNIADIDVWQGFAEGASSIKPYEPVFGYKLEDFKPQFHPGSVFEEENGYFNMTNPESLVFPEINNLQPFERFKVSEQDTLEAFLERRQPEWNIPATQKMLNKFSLIAWIVSIGILIAFQTAKTGWFNRQKNTN